MKNSLFCNSIQQQNGKTKPINITKWQTKFWHLFEFVAVFFFFTFFIKAIRGQQFVITSFYCFILQFEKKPFAHFLILLV
jgi:hypothetical protein